MYKISHVTAATRSNENPTLLLFSPSRPSLTHYLYWLLHDHRSHPASVIIKEHPALRARLDEFNGGILQSSRRRLWCVYKNLSGVHLCFDSFEASDYLGSKGRQPRSSAPGVGDFTAEFRGDWQRGERRGGQSTSVLLVKKKKRNVDEARRGKREL